MRPIAEMPPETAGRISAVFCDIDDTLTTYGRLTGSAYQALEDLHEAGVAVAPVTGRPAGWCDMIARFWPVQGVIGENGAFYYAYDPTTRKMVRRTHPELQTLADNSARFEVIRKRLAEEVPNATLSADQPFRIADLAVDFCEDIERLPNREVSRIKEIFEEEGANAKISSIHVNGWFGQYDKLSISRIFAREILGLNIDRRNMEVAFIGDSANDAPMFGFFENSCGVANMRDAGLGSSDLPKWVTSQRGGAGFCEMANHLLSARSKGVAT